MGCANGAKFVTRAPRSLCGVADQVAYSASNFLLAVMVASASSAQSFGAFAILFAAFSLLLLVFRGFVSEPCMLALAQSGGSATVRRLDVLLLPAFAAIPASAVLVLAGSVIGTISLAAAFAVGYFAVVMQDLLRYILLGAGRGDLAFIGDLVVICGVVAGFLSRSFDVFDFGVVSSAAIWAISTGLGGLVLLSLAWPLLSPSGFRLGRSSLGRSLGLDNFVSHVSQQSIPILVALMGTLGDVGAFRAAQVALMPPATILLGVQAAVVPEFVAHRRSYGLLAMKRRAGLLGAALGTAAIVYYFAILALPVELGRMVLGDSWSRGRLLLPFMGVAVIAGPFMTVGIAGLRALASGRGTLVARYLGVAMTQSLVVPLLVIEGVRGAALGLGVAAPLQAAVWWLVFREVVRRRVSRPGSGVEGNRS